MFKKIFFTIVFLGNALLFAQTGVLKGRVMDNANGEGISFANIQIEKDSITLTKTTADINGNFTIQSISPGKYNLKSESVGYSTSFVKDIIISADRTTYVDIKLKSSGVMIQEIAIIGFNVPLIDADTKSSSTITRSEIQSMPSKNVNSVISTMPGIFRRNKIDKLSVRGSRSKMSNYYVDGKKIKGRANQPNSEEYKELYENEFKKVKQDPLSTFSIDVDAASYSNIRRFINDGSLPPKDAVRLEEMINYFSYNYPKPKENEPFSINMELTNCPWNNKHQLVNVGLQGKQLETENLASSNLVFLIDVSGSMDEPDKLPLLKSSLKMLVEQLREQDRVSIVVYAGQAGMVLQSTRGDKKEKIYEAIEQLSAGGSTAGGEGILLAYKLAKENFISKGNNRVILATDGDFNVGVSSDEELSKLIEEKRNDGIFLTVLGFGTGNYKDSKMEQLADKGNGNYAYVDNLLEAKKVLVKEMGATLYTIAKDVKIQVEFNPVNVKAYRLLGYEDRILASEDFNNDKKDAGDIGSGHAVTALYEIIPAGSDEEINNVDSLKYQKTNTTQEVLQKDELMTIKFRYKEPNENKSKLIVETLGNSITPSEKISENFKFSSAVTEFGLLLRDSKYKGVANYENVIKMAKDSKGKDEEGYRAEFIRIVETAQILDKESKNVSQK